MKNWAAPRRKTILNVAAGVVLSVRITPQAGQPAIVATSQGLLPRIAYTPLVEPLGTGAPVIYDPFDGEVIGQVGERPTRLFDGAAPPEYWLDLGQPIYCPWPGTIALEGGTTASGADVLCDVETMVSVPQSGGLEHAGRDVFSHGPARRTLSRPSGQAPLSPLSPPTCTFACPTSHVATTVPRGAKTVQVSNTSAPSTSVDFAVWGTTHILYLTPGQPQPLGALAGGTFRVRTSAPLVLLTFALELG